MIKALNTATQGLLQAERRATDVAKDILKSTGQEFSRKVDAETNATEGADKLPAVSGTAPTAATGSDFGNLIQQFADLRAEEKAFQASATAFKKIDEGLGTLLDDEG